jgi:hypothetical protein
MKSIPSLLLLSTAQAFTNPTPFPRLSPHKATLTAEELSEMSTEEHLNILGVKEEELALGIDADEVLQFIGT